MKVAAIFSKSSVPVVPESDKKRHGCQLEELEELESCDYSLNVEIIESYSLKHKALARSNGIRRK